MSSETGAWCPVYSSIELLQEKWVLHIARALLRGPHGFNELSRAVGGANTTTLSQRLEHLERLGIVDKTVESTMPPRTRYELTESGRELEGIIAAIDTWARSHMRRCQDHDASGAPREPHAAGARSPVFGADEPLAQGETRAPDERGA